MKEGAFGRLARGGSGRTLDSSTCAIQEALLRSEFLRDLGEVALAKLARACTVVNHPKGQALRTLPDEDHVLHAVAQGTVRIALISAEGQEHELAYRRSGQIFVLQDSKHKDDHARVAYSARHGTVVLAMPGSAVEAALAPVPSTLSLYRLALARQGDADADLGEVMFYPVRPRLARALLKLSGPSPQRAACITHEALARTAKTTRPRTSAELAAFREQGLIAYEARDTTHTIVVLDPGGLAAIL